MKTVLINWINSAWYALTHYHDFMVWNSFLAFIPLILSVWLFRVSRFRSLFWWISAAIFLAFLPNAPYVLTDIIHLIFDIRRGYSAWIITLVLVPQYLVFMLAGFEAYVISLINLGHYLRQQSLKKYILPTEVFIHFLAAIGVYLGRFQRFNSWDFVTQPDVLAQSIIEDFTTRWPILIMSITFVVLTTFYWVMKQVTLGLVLRIRHPRIFEKALAPKERLT